jgi:2-polyprenyl-3-methyl-5-hydroxy-6-metoxy-1,4-benzoquinol methylase
VTVAYGSAETAWTGFKEILLELADRPDVGRVCEVGGGARPALSLEAIDERRLDYTLLDASEQELSKAPDGYTKLQADITVRDPASSGRYDLVFSRLVVEHIANPVAFHRNLFDMLVPGGYALHFFSTLFAPPFVVNRILPEPVATKVVQWLQPGREQTGNEGKFPAYYRWCRGPTRRQIRRFRSLGYEVHRYDGFFGTPRYYQRFPPLRKADERVARLLIEHPLPALSSFAHVLLRKPGTGAREWQRSAAPALTPAARD